MGGKEWAIVLAAAIGAASALVGGWLAGVRQLRLEDGRLELEKEKIRFAQQAELASEARKAIQECIGAMASATHSMCWIVWLGDVDPTRITEERLAQYDTEMHELLPKAISLQANVATYSKPLGNRIASILADIEDLDARIGESIIKFVSGETNILQKINAQHQEAVALHDRLEKLSMDVDVNEIVARFGAQENQSS